MLSNAEEDRLEAALVPSDPVTVSYDGKSADYDLTPFWSGPDVSGDDASEGPDLPALVFDWEVEGEPDGARQPLDDLERIENPLDDPDYREVKMVAEYSDLVLQVVVRRSWDQGIDPKTRLKQLARPVWETCTQDLDQNGLLNAEGPNGERPMTVDVLSSADTSSDDRRLRMQWTIRLNYTAEHEVVTETAGEVDYNVDVTDE